MTIPQTLQIALERHRAGRLAEAEALYRRILAAQPNQPDALHFLGAIAHQAGQHGLAVDLIRQSIVLNPQNGVAHFNLGFVHRATGQLDEAVAAFRQALKLKSNYAEAFNHLGAALARQGQLDEAVANIRRALELRPNDPDANNNLGVALWQQHKLDEAIAAFRRALEVRPDYPDAHSNLGNALKDRGELDEAIAAYRRALRIQPDYLEAHSNLVQALHYHPGHDAMAFAEEHRRWNRQFADPLQPFARPHSNDPAVGRRLRVGYVSPDFRSNPVGRFALPLFEQHDRERFEIYCYSGVTSPDGLTERFRRLAGKWRDTAGAPDARLAEMIREDGVDILVDLAMHTGGNRLLTFARQPAPVQVTWLAYPGSTGLPSIGYRLTDVHMDPPGEKPAWSAEEAVRLPDCWCCYDPVESSPEVNALPALSTGRLTFGSLNNFGKVHEGVLALWARVMDAVKGSRLLLFCPVGRARERAHAFFGARGIGPDRVEFAGFLSRGEYLRLYHRIDIGLDPFPCNGMTTTCDALSMGVPVLTLPRELPASRAGLSLLSCIGLGELAASSEDDFVRIAVELAANLPRLAEMRATLRSRMRASPLMDAPRFARNVEAAYRSMWERWRHGKDEG